jgi:hypothetical protein
MLVPVWGMGRATPCSDLSQRQGFNGSQSEAGPGPVERFRGGYALGLDGHSLTYRHLMHWVVAVTNNQFSRWGRFAAR